MVFVFLIDKKPIPCCFPESETLSNQILQNNRSNQSLLSARAGFETYWTMPNEMGAKFFGGIFWSNMFRSNTEFDQKLIEMGNRILIKYFLIE